jgi:acyl-CoA oxidase
MKATADLLTYEIITPSHARMLADAYRVEIIEMTSREAVQITDAFAFSDYELGSVLGRYDGRVYETLWEEVRKDPINAEMELKKDVLEMMKGNWRKPSKL